MRTIAHISDLHFGTESIEISEVLLRELETRQPSLVVVSGDLTQRAKPSEFYSARQFLDRIPFPQLIVPGNHDIPLYDPLRRFLRPLACYRKQITPDLCPYYADEEIAIMGINTARSLTWKSGRISHEQIEAIRQRFHPIPDTKFKLLVTHHPFIPPPGQDAGGIDLVGRASIAMETIDHCCIDLLLAGHLHHGYTGDVRAYYPTTKRSIVVIQAGTAISRRIRSEPNAYNWITLDGEDIRIDVQVWNGHRFMNSVIVKYHLCNEEWRLANR